MEILKSGYLMLINSIPSEVYLGPITGLEIHDGHTAFAVDAPGH